MEMHRERETCGQREKAESEGRERRGGKIDYHAVWLGVPS
jgi:hypothetical protein